MHFFLQWPSRPQVLRHKLLLALFALRRWYQTAPPQGGSLVEARRGVCSETNCGLTSEGPHPTLASTQVKTFLSGV